MGATAGGAQASALHLITPSRARGTLWDAACKADTVPAVLSVPGAQAALSGQDQTGSEWTHWSRLNLEMGPDKGCGYQKGQLWKDSDKLNLR